MMKSQSKLAAKRFPLVPSLIFTLFYSAAFVLAVAPQLVVQLVSGQ